MRNFVIMILVLIVIMSLMAQSNLDINRVEAQDTELQPRLRWSPPELIDPQIIDVIDDEDKDFYLNSETDYIMQMPDEPLQDTLRIFGGRNIVLIGGEISIPYQGEDASITSRTGLKLFDFEQTESRVIHIEGLLIRGEDLSEGIQIDAPNAIVQIQNVHIEDIHARDQVNFTDNHPDLIQTYGNVQELRVDYFTGSSDYQGFFFKVENGSGHGAIHLSNVNLIGRPTARFLLWFYEQDWAGEVTLDNVWIDVPEERSGGLGMAVYPSVVGDYPRQAQYNDPSVCECVFWPDEMVPIVNGFVYLGSPEEGNFVELDDVGIDYTSPGYLDTE